MLKNLRIHYLQHVPFEGPANIADWANQNGCTFTGTQIYSEDAQLPAFDDFDWLIILGGPMNIYEEENYPWLITEKLFIEHAILNGKKVLGICLGAQLIADSLGSKVYSNHTKEIGWFPVVLTKEAKESHLFGCFPEKFSPFHWHGDTFDLPPGAVRMAENETCLNQAFIYDMGRVCGLQFHLEYSIVSIEDMMKYCGEELVHGKYIQKDEDVLKNDLAVTESYILLTCLLDGMKKI